MLKIINKILRPETQFIRGSAQSFQRIHAIRPGINEYLDIIRNTYNKLTDQINEIINKLGQQYNLPLRMTYSITKDFHIQLMKSKKTAEKFLIPSNFIRISEKSNAIFLTTREIEIVNVKLKDTANEIFKCCEKIVQKLTEDLSQFNDANFLLVDTIANLDIIVSYAKVSQTNGFCCPEFGDETRIVEARHIFLENGRSNKACVPNNIIATPEYNVFILTGPNMAGKTIYLKTIALMQIIAQLGCYVPAKKAKFRICDKIFTRLGFSDKLEENSSGFINEMSEMEYIFKNITSNSLVIIDELCRTTNPIGGFNLAWKLCSKLCQFEYVDRENELENRNNPEMNENNSESEKDKGIDFVRLPMPHIYIATHFLGLTKLKEKYFNVVNLQVEAEEVSDGQSLHLKYTHKVREGVTTVQNYGLNLAKLVGLPEEIIKDAYDILNDIRMSSTKNENEDEKFELNEEIEILRKLFQSTFPSKNLKIERKNESFASVANFINNSTNEDVFNNSSFSTGKKFNSSSTTTTTTTTSNEELLEEFCFKMYDFYAEIAALQRQSSLYKMDELQRKFHDCFTNVKESIPEELHNLLTSKDIYMILKNNFPELETLFNKKNDNSNSFSEICSFKMTENNFKEAIPSYSLPNLQKTDLEEKLTVNNDEKLFVSLPTIKNGGETEFENFNLDFLRNQEEDGADQDYTQARVIQNIQIIPPGNNYENLNNFQMNSELGNFEEMVKKSETIGSLPKFNKFSDNFDFFKNFENSKSLNIEIEKSNKLENLKANKTFNLEDLKNAGANSQDLFEDINDEEKN